jgi:uncharacterized membrane protein (UPF0127 family)
VIFKRSNLYFLPLLLVMGLSSCSAQAGFEKKNMVLQGSGRTVAIQVEIARTDEQRSQGLMYRTRLDDGQGMLFIFDRDEILSFWMKNTEIPLSIAFISSDGRIMEIRDMEPHSIDSVRSSRSVRYALEVPQGWFSRVNLGVGDRLLLDSL